MKKDNLVSTNGWDLRFLVKKDRFRVPLGTHCEVNETETNSCYYVLLSFVLPDVSQRTLLAGPGEARGCSTNTSVTHSFIHSLTDSAIL